MQINVEIQEEKIKKQVLGKLKSVRKIQWKEKKSEHKLEHILEKKIWVKPNNFKIISITRN